MKIYNLVLSFCLKGGENEERFVAFTGAYFTIEVKQVSPVFRSGVFEHGAENVQHVAAVSFCRGGLS